MLLERHAGLLNAVVEGSPIGIAALDSAMSDPDVIVLCELAMFAYPAQQAQVLRVPAEMTPAALVVEVHRRVALRATLHATMAQAA